jgi:hypothetical protein
VGVVEAGAKRYAKNEPPELPVMFKVEFANVLKLTRERNPEDVK